MTSASAIPSLDGSSSAVVHPVVLFTVADAFTRRAAGMNRVIGTLLGSAKGGKVEVRQCYTVPHSETNEQVRERWGGEGCRERGQAGAARTRARARVRPVALPARVCRVCRPRRHRCALGAPP